MYFVFPKIFSNRQVKRCLTRIFLIDIFYHTQQTTQNLFLSISMKSIYKIKANKTMPENFLLFQLPVRLIYLIKRFLTERKREQSLIVRKCISSSSKHILNQTFFFTFYQTKYQTVCHIFLFLLCESM